jgi:hypothetical protein
VCEGVGVIEIKRRRSSLRLYAPRCATVSIMWHPSHTPLLTSTTTRIHYVHQNQARGQRFSISTGRHYENDIDQTIPPCTSIACAASLGYSEPWLWKGRGLRFICIPQSFSVRCWAWATGRLSEHRFEYCGGQMSRCCSIIYTLSV